MEKFLHGEESKSSEETGKRQAIERWTKTWFWDSWIRFSKYTNQKKTGWDDKIIFAVKVLS
jgi:hypothetical protein